MHVFLLEKNFLYVIIIMNRNQKENGMLNSDFIISKSLANYIHHRRLEVGVSSTDLAEISNMSKSNWESFEKNGGAIPLKSKDIILDLLFLERFPKEKECDFIDKLFEEAKENKLWPGKIYQTMGLTPALSFIAGCEILSDDINNDLEELSKLPKESHLGQLDTSLLLSLLPQQFITKYDYEFVYKLSKVLAQYTSRNKVGSSYTAHNVIEEICLYLIAKESILYFESLDENSHLQLKELLDYNDEWPFDIFDDMDSYTFLYTDIYIEEDSPYHFKNWFVPQFYL